MKINIVLLRSWPISHYDLTDISKMTYMHYEKNECNQKKNIAWLKEMKQILTTKII